MELLDFRKDFLEDVSSWAEADENFKHAAFVDYVANFLAEAEEVADFEPCYYRGIGSRGRRLSVDGYAFDDADGGLRLFLAEFNGSAEPETLIQTQARTLFGRLHAFLEDAVTGRLLEEVEESSEAHGLAATIHERRGSISKIRFYLMSDAILSSRVRDWPDEDVEGISTEYHIWDMTRFHRVSASQTGRDELVVDFTEYTPGGVPCLAASTDTPNQYTAYLAVLPARVLADIYDHFGSRLLEGNVRSFLSTRGKVNKGIRKTIAGEPEMFFAYNNGIAATATEVLLENGAGGVRLVQATDFQIVNGGQTTASLAVSRRKDKAKLDRAFVQMKLSVITPDLSGQIIPLISRYANSQNKVSDADFFSNHDFHRRVEEISRRLWAPSTGGQQYETHWFYERARGQYVNEKATRTPAEKKRFELQNPRRQLITKTDLAKFVNVWRQIPQTVSKGAQKNFLTFADYISKAWEKTSEHFNEEFFRELIAKAVVFRQTEKLVSAQPWYQGSAIRAQVVAYTISKLAQMIEVQAPKRSFDFRTVWQKQETSEALNKQLLMIAKAVFDILTADDRPIVHITEWSKKDLCWERVKALDLPLLPRVQNELVDIAVAREVRKEGRNTQRVDDTIAVQTEVVKLGSKYWAELLSWGQEKGLVDPRDERLLQLAASIPSGLPNDWQSQKLMKLKERLEHDGFGWLS